MTPRFASQGERAGRWNVTGVVRSLTVWAIIASLLVFALPVPPQFSFLSLFEGAVESDKGPVLALITIGFCTLLDALAFAMASGRVRWILCFPITICLLYAGHWLLDNSPPPVLPIFSWSLCVWSISSAERHSDVRLITSVVWLVLISHALTAVVLFNTGFRQFETPGFGMRCSGVYGTPNTMYPLLITAYVLAYIRSHVDRDRKTNPISVLVFGVTFALIILTFTRAAWTAIGVLNLCLAFRDRCYGKWHGAFLFTCGVLLLGATFYVRTNGSLLTVDNDKSVSGRMLIWADAGRIAASRPVFGYGHGGFRNSPFFRATDEPKNLFLFFLIESGLVGSVSVLIGSALIFRRLRDASRDGPPDDLRLVVAVSQYSLVAFFISGFTDTPVFGPMERLPGTLVFASLLGCGVGGAFMRSDGGQGAGGEGRP